MDKVHICGRAPIGRLTPKDRTEENVLEILREDPRISYYTMTEHHVWLEPILKRLERDGKITSTPEGFPCWRYDVIEPGHASQ